MGLVGSSRLDAAELARAFAEQAAAAVRKLMAAHEDRRAVAELSNMSDAQLRDIGVDREKIVSTVRRFRDTAK